jgi:hypothetical protein
VKRNAPDDDESSGEDGDEGQVSITAFACTHTLKNYSVCIKPPKKKQKVSMSPAWICSGTRF